MTTAVKLKAIDADAHVVESERTWDHLDPADEKFRPQLFSSPDNEKSRYWVIDGQDRGAASPDALGARTARDVGARPGATWSRRRTRGTSTTSTCGCATWTSSASTSRSCTTRCGYATLRGGPRSTAPSAGRGTAGWPTRGSSRTTGFGGRRCCRSPTSTRPSP